jgi:hypothetical protein
MWGMVDGAWDAFDGMWGVVVVEGCCEDADRNFLHAGVVALFGLERGTGTRNLCGLDFLFLLLPLEPAGLVMVVAVWW